MSKNGELINRLCAEIEARLKAEQTVRSYSTELERMALENAQLRKKLKDTDDRLQRLDDAVAEYEHLVDDLKQRVISGFYEEKVPQYRQGVPAHELEDYVTAEEVQQLATSLHAAWEQTEKLQAKVDELLEREYRAHNE